MTSTNGSSAESTWLEKIAEEAAGNIKRLEAERDVVAAHLAGINDELKAAHRIIGFVHPEEAAAKSGRSSKSRDRMGSHVQVRKNGGIGSAGPDAVEKLLTVIRSVPDGQLFTTVDLSDRTGIARTTVNGVVQALREIEALGKAGKDGMKIRYRVLDLGAYDRAVEAVANGSA